MRKRSPRRVQNRWSSFAQVTRVASRRSLTRGGDTLGEVSRAPSPGFPSGVRSRRAHANEYREVAVRPCDLGLQPRFGKPPELVHDGAGRVVVAVNRCHDVVWVLWHDDIAEHDPPARGEIACHAPE